MSLGGLWSFGLRDEKLHPSWLRRGTLASALGPPTSDPLKVSQQALTYRLCIVVVPSKRLQAGQLSPVPHELLAPFKNLCISQSALRTSPPKVRRMFELHCCSMHCGSKDRRCCLKLLIQTWCQKPQGGQVWFGVRPMRADEVAESTCPRTMQSFPLHRF